MLQFLIQVPTLLLVFIAFAPIIVTILGRGLPSKAQVKKIEQKINQQVQQTPKVEEEPPKQQHVEDDTSDDYEDFVKEIRQEFEIDDIREKVREGDADQDGFLTREEVRTVLKENGIQFSDSYLNKLLDRLSSGNDDDLIKVEDFLAV